jgi:hypothetical protein
MATVFKILHHKLNQKKLQKGLKTIITLNP